MKIYTKYNIATWLRLVKFTELKMEIQKSKFANIEFCEFDQSEPYMSLYYILCIFSFFRVYEAGYKRSLT